MKGGAEAQWTFKEEREEEWQKLQEGVARQSLGETKQELANGETHRTQQVGLCLAAGSDKHFLGMHTPVNPKHYLQFSVVLCSCFIKLFTLSVSIQISQTNLCVDGDFSFLMILLKCFIGKCFCVISNFFLARLSVVFCNSLLGYKYIMLWGFYFLDIKI